MSEKFYIVKDIHPVIKEVNNEDRSFWAVASTESPDRYGDVVRQDGWVVDNFMKNPVILWAHDYRRPPVGRVEEVKVENGQLLFKAKFLPEGLDPEADKIFEMYKSGFLKAFSVGFMPLEYEANEHGGTTFKKQELLEISAVPVPANPEALTLAFKMIKEQEEKTAVRPHDVGEVDMDSSWDANKAIAQLRKWASSDGSGDKDKIDWKKYRQGFAWYDGENPDKLGSYKLPHHYVKDGKLITVWRGVVAAMAALFGARGGVNIPEKDKRKVYDHLAAHYKQAGKEPPEWETLELLEEINKAHKATHDNAVKNLITLFSTLTEAYTEQLKTLGDEILEKFAIMEDELNRIKEMVKVNDEEEKEDIVKIKEELVKALKENLKEVF